MLHISDLLNRVLIKPADQFNSLLAVSGFVSGPMALRHVHGNKDLGVSSLPDHVQVNLVYGMYKGEGVLRSDHKTFTNLMESFENFKVHYYDGPRPVHSKVYVWSNGNVPALAFIGSANYSVASFYGRIQEAITEVDPQSAFEYANKLLQDCRSVLETFHPRIRSKYIGEPQGEEAAISTFDELIASLPFVDLPLFIVKENRIHEKSGLNWGQRDGREPNQAYVPIPAEIAQSGFFPARGDWFSLLTDDEQLFDCVVAQDGDKALETPIDNSLIGAYFRNRLGVPLGEKVELAHLDNYGRRFVRVFKADEARYLLDFRR